MASVMVPPQVLLGLENEWTRTQTVYDSAGIGLLIKSASATMQLRAQANSNICQINANYVGRGNPGGSLELQAWPGQPVSSLYLYSDSTQAISNGVALTQLDIGQIPAQSTLTVVSGTVYQNTTNRYLSIDVAVYATTTGTAGTMAFARGASSTPSTIWTRMVSSATTSTSTDVQPIRIQPGFYWSLTLSGATFGTITQVEE